MAVTETPGGSVQPQETRTESVDEDNDDLEDMKNRLEALKS